MALQQIFLFVVQRNTLTGGGARRSAPPSLTFPPLLVLRRSAITLASVGELRDPAEPAASALRSAPAASRCAIPAFALRLRSASRSAARVALRLALRGLRLRRGRFQSARAATALSVDDAVGVSLTSWRWTGWAAIGFYVVAASSPFFNLLYKNITSEPLVRPDRFIINFVP